MTNRILHTYFLLIISLSIVIVSCSDKLIDNPYDIVFPDSNVSFQEHVQPVITLNCSYQGCHSDYTQAAGIRLTDYFSYFDNPSVLGLVVPGNPDGSRLVQIIENPLIHKPYILWDLNDNHKQGIRKWIEENAQNN